MRSVTELPEGYRAIFSVDLQKDKKTALFVNLLGAAILLLMAVPMHFAVPISALFSFEQGFGMYFLRFGVLLLSNFLYIVLHELTHAAVMRIYGAKKVRFGFTGLYAFAGSEADYFGKGPYLQIALAPLVLFGILLIPVCAFVPQEWFWVAYSVELANVSGAVGDLYVSAKFLRMPKDILVRDTGVSMTVYSKETKENTDPR